MNDTKRKERRWKIKGTFKFVHVHDMKVYGSGGVAPLIPNICYR